jgi:restriction endonuclease S subunit
MRKKLGELVEIRPGYHFRGRIKNDPRGDLVVVQAKDLVETLELESSFRISMQNSIPKHYFLRESDVLLINRGDRNRAALMRSFTIPVVCSSTLYILRTIGPELLPAFLVTFLNLPTTQSALRSATTGPTTPLLNRDRLNDVVVPLPDVRTQTVLAEIDSLLVCERQLSTQLSAQRHLLLAGLINQS